MKELVLECVVIVAVAFHTRTWNWKAAVPFLVLVTLALESAGHYL